MKLPTKINVNIIEEYLKDPDHNDLIKNAKGIREYLLNQVMCAELSGWNCGFKSNIDYQRDCFNLIDKLDTIISKNKTSLDGAGI